MIELATITFNHDLTSSTTSALNIRRNKDFEVPRPEWDSASPRPPEQSCAAYAIAETQGQPVVIWAEFRVPAPSSDTYEVRATGGGVLGRLEAFPVAFAGSTSSTVDIPLAHRRYYTVGRYDITWTWTFRRTGESTWQPLATTSHRIYMVLAVPRAPWVQNFGDRHVPWTDLLDVACVVAQGSTLPRVATRAITIAINRSYELKYNVTYSGQPQYGFTVAGTYFLLTYWIEYVLRGNFPQEFTEQNLMCDPDTRIWWIAKTVACYDCAAAVALMSRVVGALAEYHFHEPFGYLKYVQPIGRGKGNNPFYNSVCITQAAEVGPDVGRSYFLNHTYVKLDGRNYDATIRQWVDDFTRLVYLAAALVMSLWPDISMMLYDRAFGYLNNIGQSDYEDRVIDASTPWEQQEAGGAPRLEALDFEVV